MDDAAAHDAFGVLDRMTSILEAFDQDDRGLGISELAARAGLPKSTVSRMVATLVSQGYLERAGKRVHLGLRLFELGQLADQPQRWRIAALPVMADLRNTTGGNVHLAIRDRNEVVCIAVLHGRVAAPPVARIGARLPIHATALGKAVLAHLPIADLDEIVSSGLVSSTSQTIVDPAVLGRELDSIRRGELATQVGEYAAELSCAASAVFAPGGGTIGAISVSGDPDGFDAERLAPAIHNAALTLTRRLAQGGSGTI